MRGVVRGWLTAGAIALVAAASSAQTVDVPSIVDSRDGQRYDVVSINGRDWLARNLAFAATPSWCYGDRLEGCGQHGRLYQWDVAMSACAGLRASPAPGDRLPPPDPVSVTTGWRLPSDRDWMDLEVALGMQRSDLEREGPRGSDQGARLRSGGSSGLAILLSGYRRPAGDYARRNERAAFWAATEANAEDAWHRDIRPDVDTIYRSPVTKSYALSVRCVR